MRTLKSGISGKMFFIILTAALFLIDLIAPPALAAWMLYILMPLFLGPEAGRRERILAASICTVLILTAGILASPSEPIDLLNRALGIALLWITALRWVGTPEDSRRQSAERMALKVALIYLAIGVVWITFSDTLLARLASDPALLLQISEIKGWAFVLITAILLYVMLQRSLASRLSIEEALSRSDEMFRTSFDSAPIGMALISSNGRFLRVNSALCQLLGFSEREFLARTLRMLVHPAEAPSLESALHDRTRKYFTSQFRLVKADGSYVWCEVISAALRTSKSNDEFSILQVHDISERIQSNEALQSSEAYYRMLFHQSPTPMWLFDPETLRFLDVNDAAVRHYGYSREEFLAMTIKDIRPASEIPRLLEWVKARPQPDLTTSFWHHVKKDGTLINVAIVSTDFQYKGRSVRLVHVNDITEQLNATQQRDLFFRLSTDVFMVVGFDGYVKQANPALTRILGWTLQEMLMRPLADLVHPADMPRSRAILDLVLAGNTTEGFENRILCKDGSFRWMSWNAVTSPEHKTIFAVGRDVTAQKQQVEAMVESEAQYRRIIEIANEGIWQTDASDRITFANQHIARMLGYAIHEMIGKQLLQFVDPADLPAMRKRLDERHQGAQARYEVRLRKNDNTPIWALVSSTAIIRSDGAYGGALKMIVDITQRRQAEEALRASEQRYLAIIETQGDAVCRWLPDTTLTFTNTQYRRLFNLPEKPTAPVKWISFIPEYQREAFERHYTELAKNPRTVTHEISISLNDGTQLWYDWRDIPLFDEKGQLIEFQSVGRDITERRRAQDAIRESEERLRLALRAANQGLYDLNVQTGETVFSNEYATMLGYDPGEFHETNAAWIERLHPDDREATAATYRDYIAGKIPEYRVEFRQKTKSGDWKWILSIGKVVEYDAEGRPLRMLGTHTDITARKQAEEALRESEEQFRHLLDSMQDVAWASPLGGGKWLYVNRAAERIYGRSLLEFYSNPNIWIDAVHPEDKEIAIRSGHEVLESGESQAEYRIVRPDGTVRWILDRKRIIRDGRGEAKQLGGLGIDITALKQYEAEQQRLAAEKARLFARLQIIIERSPIAIVVCEPDMRIVEWNAASERIFGHTRSEVLNKDAIGIVIPETLRPAMQQMVSQVQMTDQTIEHINENITKDGRTILCQWHNTALFNEKGQFVGILAMALDITKRKEAEEHIRYQAGLLENVSDSIISTDMQLRIRTWNKAAEAMYKQRADDVLGRKLSDVIRSVSAKPSYDEIVRMALEAGVWNGEAEHVAENGRVLSVLSTITLLKDESGTPTGIVVVNRDITEQKRAQEELRRSEENLRRLSGYLQNVREEERKRIAREIHDELGQQLTALKIEASLLHKHCTRLDKIIDSTPLLEHTNTLSAIAETTITTLRRIAAELRPSVLDKLGLIDALQWHAQEFEERVGITCSIRTSVTNADVNEEIATALFRIFQEALTNVARHAHATHVDVAFEKNDSQFALRIHDNGRGIRPDEIADAHSLGLLGIFERARLLGGKAHIKGEPAGGTTLDIVVPITTTHHVQ